MVLYSDGHVLPLYSYSCFTGVCLGWLAFWGFRYAQDFALLSIFERARSKINFKRGSPCALLLIRMYIRKLKLVLQYHTTVGMIPTYVKKGYSHTPIRTTEGSCCVVVVVMLAALMLAQPQHTNWLMVGQAVGQVTHTFLVASNRKNHDETSISRNKKVAEICCRVF